ncbi:MAG: HEPN domain-containing protein [Candidatus Omnitrophota bacterium]|nr:MAG: HEPN domain-containing protein [Candidatus Omnitrophota bacterium]
MIYKDTINSLLKENIIKKCLIDYKIIKNLINRAHVDLNTAKRNLDDDEECAYTYAYNALLRSGLALMFNEGFRPEIKNKHLTVIKFASSILGNKFGRIINNYDFMRRKRHRFIYEPDIPCSKKEAEEAIKTAREFVGIISKLIKEKNPQMEFNF